MNALNPKFWLLFKSLPHLISCLKKNIQNNIWKAAKMSLIRWRHFSTRILFKPSHFGFKLYKKALANKYLFKVKNRSTSKRCEICSKLIIMTPVPRQWCHTGILIIIIFHSHFFLVLFFFVFTDYEKLNVC